MGWMPQTLLEQRGHSGNIILVEAFSSLTLMEICLLNATFQEILSIRIGKSGPHKTFSVLIVFKLNSLDFMMKIHCIRLTAHFLHAEHINSKEYL